jgi:DNA replication protein DnaC
MKPTPDTTCTAQLDYLQLPYIKAHHSELAQEAARPPWDHPQYLQRLMDGECAQRRQRSLQRRIKAAHFPVVKTLEQFRWDWPKKINRLQIQNLFRLEFIPQTGNVIFLGTVGVGKTHWAAALGYAACLEGYSVLCAGAVAVINDLTAAQQSGALKPALKKYLSPQVLILDEVAYATSFRVSWCLSWPRRPECKRRSEPSAPGAMWFGSCLRNWLTALV